MSVRGVAKALVAVAAALAAVACAEVILRWTDGYRIASVALHAASTHRDPEPASGVAPDVRYASQVPVAPGIDRAWYAHELPRQPSVPTDAELERRAARYPTDSITPFFSFNRRYLEREVCGGARAGELAKLDDFFYYDPLDASPYPTYRHLRHARPPGWFWTNNFGWRGHDVTLNRPTNVIRLAFVGASTTIGAYAAPTSYPQLVEFWLNEWAAAGGRPYRFEAINAARTGVDSRSIAAIVKAELAPVDPDLVVFYEGANQFWPGQMVNVHLGRFFRRPAATFRKRVAAEDYSAIARRVLSVVDRFGGGDGREPRKPPYTVDWPRGLDERTPDLSAPVLPMDLKQVVADLDRMRDALAARSGELAVSSFIWLVHEGMQLDLNRHLTIYRFLNDSYWPITYAQMRRMADFQNHVFETYARSRRVPYIDIAARFPADPDLFDDAIHLRPEGVKLQAWMFVQSLVPLILERTTAGRWPRPADTPQDVHPAFDQPDRRVMTLAVLKAHCS